MYGQNVAAGVVALWLASSVPGVPNVVASRSVERLKRVSHFPLATVWYSTPTTPRSLIATSGFIALVIVSKSFDQSTPRLIERRRWMVSLLAPFASPHATETRSLFEGATAIDA